MKKTYLNLKRAFFVIMLGTVFLLIAIINSCKKEEKQTQLDVATVNKISQTKAWYQKTYPVTVSKSDLKTQGLSSSGSNDFSQVLKPDWEQAAAYSRLNSEVVEMPLDSAAKLALVDKNVNINTFDFNKSYSKSSFLILNDGSNYSAYIMTIVADSSYLKNDFSKLSNNTYRKHDKDFTGYLLYYTPKGVFVSGWHYQNGKINKALSATTSSSTGFKIESTGSSKLKTLVNGCQIQTFTFYTYGYVAGNLSTIFIDIYYYYVCDEMGNQPEDPGGGGYPPPGGGGGATVVSTADTIKIGHVCDNLTPEQVQTIITNVNNFTTHDCATKFLSKNLKSKISSFCITDLGPNPPNARYNATTGEIDFESKYAATDLESLEHEMFHAFQDQTYGHATYLSYGTLLPGNVYPSGFIDVEFEQAIFEDIVNKTHYVTAHTNDANFKTAYDTWINSLTNNGTSYPKLNPQTDITQYNNFITQYQSFLSQYQQIIGNPYYSPIANYTPNALINMFNAIDPNNC